MSMEGETHRPFDVCVVGAGPAGAVAAAYLAKSGCSVALLAPDRQEISGLEPLGETIPPAAVFLLEDIAGRALDLSRQGHREWLGRRSAWSSEELFEHSSMFDLQGHGWRIARGELEELLLALAAAQGVTICRGWRLASHGLVRSAGSWRIGVFDSARRGRELDAEILIDATGRKSCVLRQLRGVGKRRTFDRLVCLAMDFPLEGTPRSTDATSVVEVAENGYWYSVLSPENRRVLAYFTDSDLLTPGEMRDSGFFFRQLDGTRAMGALLEECRIEDRLNGRGHGARESPRVRVASSSRHRAMTGEGWFALGDAAMTFDPICSQGIYTAMRLGLEAARAIERGTRCAADRFQAYVDSTWDRYLFSLGECYFTAEPPRASKGGAVFWQRRLLERINRWTYAQPPTAKASGPRRANGRLASMAMSNG